MLAQKQKLSVIGIKHPMDTDPLKKNSDPDPFGQKSRIINPATDKRVFRIQKDLHYYDQLTKKKAFV